MHGLREDDRQRQCVGSYEALGRLFAKCEKDGTTLGALIVGILRIGLRTTNPIFHE